MVTRDLSADDVVKVLCNKGNFEWSRTNGDHAILKWTHPDGPEIESRTVTVPLHVRLNIRTLRKIADQSGAKEFNSFCAWIDRNR